jgi:hypothetical protein
MNGGHDWPHSTWSIDVYFPAQLVYASASLSFVTVVNEVFCGIQFYIVVESVGGVPVPVVRVPTITNNGVAPSIKDDNVVAVSFLYGAA